MPDDRPNILLIASDQHRSASTGCYGEDGVETPHIDGLAERGTLFENAFCTSPLCGPSRGSLFTGTHPHTNGFVTHMNDRHRSGKTYRPQRRNDVHSLVRSLRDAEYRTHGSGFHGIHLYDGEENLGDDPAFMGFETTGAEDYGQFVDGEVVSQYHLNGIDGEMWEPDYFNVDGDSFPYDEDPYDTHIADDAASFIDDASGEDAPFCAYVGFRAPHPPWCAPEKFHEQYAPEDVDPLPNWTDPPTERKPRRLVERHRYFDIPHYSEGMIRRSIAAYHAFVAYMDDCVGRVLDALDAAGERENTIVVYTSDHGENLYRRGLCEKHTFYEDSIRVPLVIAGPDVPAGRRTDSLASLMDVLPTLLSMTGTDWPAFVEGRDLQPAFHGNDVREHVFAEYYHSLDPCRMVRGKRYKYIHTEEDIDELYDLENDPREETNLAWYPAYADRVAEMDDRVMDDWEIPDVPIWGTWNDLYERKQRQLRDGFDGKDLRSDPPAWVDGE